MTSLPYPSDLSSSLDLVEVVLNHFSIAGLQRPFQLPRFSPTFPSVAAFVELEVKVQLELMREEFHNKICHVINFPKPEQEGIRKAEKHLKFYLPYDCRAAAESFHLTLPSSSSVEKVPPRSQWSNYFVVLQTQSQESNTNELQHVALAYCKQLRKDGVAFQLSRHDSAKIAHLEPQTEIFCRPLAGGTFKKTLFQALKELEISATSLENSLVTKQILQGHLDTHIKTLDELDQWIGSSKAGSDGLAIDLDQFNHQQQRALALDALSAEGIVMCQGPPGTGKSHILCHGLLPQAVQRREKVLVVCNSNVAVDALMLKSVKISGLVGRMIRCGFKGNIDDEIVKMGLYAEGDAEAIMDRYGNQPGSNSNTNDQLVQGQIRAKKIVFTTIHYASKEKKASTSTAYWNFDTLILDEAAQIEDSKLFVLLARCPSLKKILLIGDPKQIQPYISDSLRKQGYGKSTMERLMESATSNAATDSGKAPFVMLERQFRMAPLLRSVVSELFYDNRLEDDECVKDRGPIKSVPLTPLLVINVRGTKMMFSKLHQSYANHGEATVVKEIYDFLFSADFNEVLNTGSLQFDDVCVLTPYNLHKDRLRSLICGANEDDLDAYAGHVYGRSQGSPAKKSQSILGLSADDNVDANKATQLQNIDTVDKFQGSERKVVIVSTCVDQKPQRAADPHFIDVACSRAQHLLIVVGNFTDALALDPNWSRVHARAVEEGTYLEHTIDTDEEDSFDASRLMEKVAKLVESKSKKRRTS
ncbi:Regulator of nonsense transcripts 1 [Seminavis robusta]|uniref:Regulator of nonsense transcripts 1 n=1 Tax=Seminavis robusta TaxID=568900 RepID=A0A9N8DB97_9STRA|nr:Regulator of nonsense transcripts 1 [Seminavis robusta]|eukprot:Sro21_g014970.1 Regulator of nonsense transcripts 1 (758) ;mRNA; r:152967-155240